MKIKKIEWRNVASYGNAIRDAGPDASGNGTPRTGPETRPINANVNYIIKI